MFIMFGKSYVMHMTIVPSSFMVYFHYVWVFFREFLDNIIDLGIFGEREYGVLEFLASIVDMLLANLELKRYSILINVY